MEVLINPGKKYIRQRVGYRTSNSLGAHMILDVSNKWTFNEEVTFGFSYQAINIIVAIEFTKFRVRYSSSIELAKKCKTKEAFDLEG